mmetsp:Transcript_1301/g.4879  ORF Transcript_1301/g.4879 Transcript_1301/m.4879 type:complete len:273 (-) Transcript_1301:568-1386(-)
MHQKAAEHPGSSGLPRHQRLPQLLGQHPVPLKQTPAQHDRHDVPVRVLFKRPRRVARVGGGAKAAPAFNRHVHREYLLPQTLRGVVHDTHGHGVPFRRRPRHERRQVGNLGPLRRRSARVRPPSQFVRDVRSAGSEPKFREDVPVKPRGRTPTVLHPRRRVERPGAEVVPAAPVLERGAPATRSSADGASYLHAAPRRVLVLVVVRLSIHSCVSASCVPSRRTHPEGDGAGPRHDRDASHGSLRSARQRARRVVVHDESAREPGHPRDERVS